MENDDATAERLSDLFTSVGIAPRDIVPWNAYPWYINRSSTACQLEQGVEPLLELLKLLPNLRVVMLHGGSAHTGWRRLSRRSPATPDGLTLIETYHTSRQAFWHADPAVRQQRADHLERSFAVAGAALNPAHD